tara:strand:+ start:2427 stop:4307 length:1881 start_codon:yes stop_codon:yes gene_type:complete
MCGIYGFSTRHSIREKKLILSEIGLANRKRGPNHSDSYINKNIAIGIERLSILDIENGNQPILSNNKKFIIVHNGEVYNFIELRKGLESLGYNFHTNTDTEVIVNLYQQYGLKSLPLLNGMFAFAIYEIDTKRLIICRDRYGIKPLHYSSLNSDIVFSSQLSGITHHPFVGNQISYNSIDYYLTLDYVPAPYTIYKNIKKLEPGHYLIWSENGVKVKKWYDLKYYPKARFKSENEFINNLHDKIEKSVKIRMRSDVPVGTFLSGGLDSSLILYFLSKYSNKNLNTYNIAFENKSFDESKYAKEVANIFGVKYQSNIFDAKSMIDILPEIWLNMDEPFSDPSFLPTFFLSKIASENISVALSGDGGDEIFAGYPTYLAHKIANKIPSFVHPLLESLVNVLPSNFDNISFDFKAKRFINCLGSKPFLRHQYWLGSFQDSDKQKSYLKSFKERLDKNRGLENLISRYLGDMNILDWETYLYQDMRFYLQDDMLVKVDRASMANSLEVRTPFLDHNIVEFMARAPKSIKYPFFKSKYILKKLSKKYLPKLIVNRSKKGFGIPIAHWLNSNLKSNLKEVIYDPESIINSILDKEDNIRLMEDHFNKKVDNRKKLWNLFVFENWAREKNINI